MNAFTKAKIAAAALFVMISAGFITYHVMYIAPGRECEASGRWWARQWRQCVSPVSISSLTGRPNPTPDAAEGAPTSQ